MQMQYSVFAGVEALAKYYGKKKIKIAFLFFLFSLLWVCKMLILDYRTKFVTKKFEKK